MLEALDRWSASAGWEAYLVLGLCALIASVFPLRGDTVVLRGGIHPENRMGWSAP